MNETTARHEEAPHVLMFIPDDYLGIRLGCERCRAGTETFRTPPDQPFTPQQQAAVLPLLAHPASPPRGAARPGGGDAVSDYSVICHECGYRGHAEPTPEYLASVELPDWQPGDIFHAFGACPACEEGLTWDAGADVPALAEAP